MSEARSAEAQAPASDAQALASDAQAPASDAQAPAAEAEAPAGTAPEGFDTDPLAQMRASLGLPHRSGGNPIDSNLDVTLRRLGWGMLGLGTVFLLLWRILSWVDA